MENGLSYEQTIIANSAKAEKYDRLISIYRQYCVYQHGLADLIDHSQSEIDSNTAVSDENNKQLPSLKEENFKILSIIEILEKNLFDDGILKKEEVLKLSPYTETPKD